MRCPLAPRPETRPERHRDLDSHEVPSVGAIRCIFHRLGMVNAMSSDERGLCDAVQCFVGDGVVAKSPRILRSY